MQLEIPLKTVYYAIDFARQHQITVILNPAPAVATLDIDYACKCDFFMPNETELEILTRVEMPLAVPTLMAGVRGATIAIVATATIAPLAGGLTLGGTDQTFNLMAGRGLQQNAGQEPQCVLTMPLMEGLDGSAKMSKSLGNAIGLTDEPHDMYGKTMRLRDELIVKYLRLATDVPPDEVDDIAAHMTDGSLNPRDAKRRLARELVTLYHSPAAARAARLRPPARR